MSTYFYRSAARLDKFKTQQEMQGTPQQKPRKTGNAIWWRFSYQLVEWNRVQQKAVQNYDIVYGAEARREDGPNSDNLMEFGDWLVNKHSAAILEPAASAVNLIEGTLYVTASLVLPCEYVCIKKASKVDVSCPRDNSIVSENEQTPEVRAARGEYAKSLKERFQTKLPSAVHRQYAIATLLDPRCRQYTFMDSGERDEAVEQLQEEWRTNWKGPAAPAQVEPEQAQQKTHGLAPLLDNEE